MDPRTEYSVDIADALRSTRSRIATAACDARRDPVSVGWSRYRSSIRAAARAALEAGQRLFGENRVQEAKEKFPALREDFPDLRLHLIGPLQTNKVRDAVALFDVIETLDRPRLAEALKKEMDRAGRRPDLLVQVNTGAEPQKAGVLPQEADAFIEACRERLGLPVVGLMCIPRWTKNPPCISPCWPIWRRATDSAFCRWE